MNTKGPSQKELSEGLLAETLEALTELEARYEESAYLSRREGDEEDAEEMFERRDNVTALSSALSDLHRLLWGEE